MNKIKVGDIVIVKTISDVRIAVTHITEKVNFKEFIFPIYPKSSNLLLCYP